MRAYLPAYDLRAPETLREALALLADRARRWRPFAGGTDLMVLLEAGHAARRPLCRPVEADRAARHSRDRRRRVAHRRADDLHRHPPRRACCATAFPLLCRAAAETGGVATQNRGTIGGNIANASPAADTPPALLVYDAELELHLGRGARAACPTIDFIAATRRWISRPTSSSRASICRRPTRGRLSVLPQGRHATRAGDLEGLSRRVDRSRSEHPDDSRRSHRGEQRRADGEALSPRGGRAPRPRVRRWSRR